jgi:hypothetical protein
MTDIERIFCSNYVRVAIFMTAKARESLCKTIRQIEAVYPDSVLRTHTDSVIVKAGTDVTKVKGFAIGSGIGEWKVETKKDKDGNEVRCEGKCEIISSMEVYWHGAEKKKRKNDI